jgi:hypothetical protein
MTDLRHHLRVALDADEDDEKNFHIRQALQHCDVDGAERTDGPTAP